MEEQQVTIRTVLLNGLTGTAEINATSEVAVFINPEEIEVIPDVTQTLAEIQRIGTPPVQTIVIILKS